MEDKRFNHIATDPLFRRFPKSVRKVKIDKRFQSMFKDKQFKVKYKIDCRGRPLNTTSTEDLKRYYDLSSSDEEEAPETDTKFAKLVKTPTNSDVKVLAKEDAKHVKTPKDSDVKVSTKKVAKHVRTPEDSDVKVSAKEVAKHVKTPKDSGVKVDKHVKTPKDSDVKVSAKEIAKQVKTPKDSDVKVSDVIKKKLKNLQVDYARGEVNLFSESSSDDESESEAVNSNEIEHKWGELDADAERTEEQTRRLAACNMDWDRIRATDLMVIFNSFVPQKGFIESVAIYPSEFGKERMKEEELRGPIELVENKEFDGNERDEENEEGSKFHMEKLRQYQLNRLKYYYAVIVCDSTDTANKVYSDCDGMEYESSATKIDLRFIPDGMTFDEEPKEICDKLPDTSKYQPRFFTTTALQQAKVDLTWDETDPERTELFQKLASGKIDDIDENDLQAYLGSSSGEDEEDDAKSDCKNNKGTSIEKYRALINEIETKEKEKDKEDIGLEISWGIDIKKKTDELIKNKQPENEVKTPFQQYLDKRKEKSKEKREQRKKRLENEKNDSDETDSDIPSDIDMNDPYFAEEFDKSEFKKIKKKSKHTKDEDKEVNEQKQAELELLLMNDDDKKHFNLKRIQDQENESKSKKKRNKKQVKEVKSDDFEIDVADPRFSALYTSHHYSIDPTDSHYRKTKNMEKLIDEKMKRRNEGEQRDESKKQKVDNKRQDAELNVLVKSVKRKVQAFVNKTS